MRLLDDNGEELDAEFDLHPTELGVEVVLHARGGSKQGSTTNADYFSALEQILDRMTRVSATLTSVVVDSSVARRLPVEARAVDLPYPVRLGPSTDTLELRVRITEGQRTVASTVAPGTAGGNKHKRIRMSFSYDVNLHDLDELFDASANSRAPSDSRSAESLGRPYTDDAANPQISPSRVFTRDDTKLERALAGHAAIQNGLASFLRENGIEPRKRVKGEPDFDIAWVDRGGPVVAEVKSLPTANAVHQLRTGIGQVLQYRELLRAERRTEVRAVLVVEHDPGDPWPAVCSRAGITLTWPPSWPGLDVDGEARGDQPPTGTGGQR